MTSGHHFFASFYIKICDTRTYNSSNFPLTEGKKGLSVLHSHVIFEWIWLQLWNCHQSKEKSVLHLFLMKHEHPVCCSTSLQFVFSATTFLMTSVHPAIAFLHIFCKWNFTKGLADRGKLNHSLPKWDASTPQLFSYRESSLLQKEAAIITVSVPQTNPQQKAARLVLQIPVPHLKCPGANL